MRGYRITYTFEGKEYSSTWYARSKKNAVGLFSMWHDSAVILRVEVL